MRAWLQTLNQGWETQMVRRHRASHETLSVTYFLTRLIHVTAYSQEWKLRLHLLGSCESFHAATTHHTQGLEVQRWPRTRDRSMATPSEDTETEKLQARTQPSPPAIGCAAVSAASQATQPPCDDPTSKTFPWAAFALEAVSKLAANERLSNEARARGQSSSHNSDKICAC